MRRRDVRALFERVKKAEEESARMSAELTGLRRTVEDMEKSKETQERRSEKSVASGVARGLRNAKQAAMSRKEKAIAAVQEQQSMPSSAGALERRVLAKEVELLLRERDEQADWEKDSPREAVSQLTAVGNQGQGAAGKAKRVQGGRKWSERIKRVRSLLAQRRLSDTDRDELLQLRSGLPSKWVTRVTRALGKACAETPPAHARSSPRTEASRGCVSDPGPLELGAESPESTEMPGPARNLASPPEIKLKPGEEIRHQKKVDGLRVAYVRDKARGLAEFRCECGLRKPDWFDEVSDSEEDEEGERERNHGEEQRLGEFAAHHRCALRCPPAETEGSEEVGGAGQNSAVRGALVPRRWICACQQVHQQMLDDTDVAGLCLPVAVAKGCQTPGLVEEVYGGFLAWMAQDPQTATRTFQGLRARGVPMAQAAFAAQPQPAQTAQLGWCRDLESRLKTGTEVPGFGMALRDLRALLAMKDGPGRPVFRAVFTVHVHRQPGAACQITWMGLGAPPAVLPAPQGEIFYAQRHWMAVTRRGFLSREAMVDRHLAGTAPDFRDEEDEEVALIEKDVLAQLKSDFEAGPVGKAEERISERRGYIAQTVDESMRVLELTVPSVHSWLRMRCRAVVGVMVARSLAERQLAEATVECDHMLVAENSAASWCWSLRRLLPGRFTSCAVVFVLLGRLRSVLLGPAPPPWLGEFFAIMPPAVRQAVGLAFRALFARVEPFFRRLPLLRRLVGAGPGRLVLAVWALELLTRSSLVAAALKHVNFWRSVPANWNELPASVRWRVWERAAVSRGRISGVQTGLSLLLLALAARLAGRR